MTTSPEYPSSSCRKRQATTQNDFEKIAKLGEQLHEAKRAERKRKLRVQILEKRLDLSRRILEEEIRSLDRDESSLDKLFHDETESSSNKRKRIAHEKSRLQDALGKNREETEKELEKLSQREFDNQFYVKLRKLEGADFDSPFNFAWYIDFPGIFGGQMVSQAGSTLLSATRHSLQRVTLRNVNCGGTAGHGVSMGHTSSSAHSSS